MTRPACRRWLLLCALALVAGVPAAFAQDDPDPGRFAAEIEAFEAWDLKNVTPSRPVLFVGSSSIRMWPTAIYFPDLPVVNRGFGGSHISDVNFYLERIVIKYAPRAIVFYAGDNDIAGGKSPQQVLEDYQAFVTRVHQVVPRVQILFVPIKPSLSRWEMWPQMAEANALVAAYSDTEPTLHYVDMATPMLGADGTPRPEFFLDDGLHLNRAGYDLWTQIMHPRLHAALGGRPGAVQRRGGR